MYWSCTECEKQWLLWVQRVVSVLVVYSCDCGSLGATTYYHFLAPWEKILSQTISPEEDQSSQFEIQFLLNVYSYSLNAHHYKIGKAEVGHCELGTNYIMTWSHKAPILHLMLQTREIARTVTICFLGFWLVDWNMNQIMAHSEQIRHAPPALA